MITFNNTITILHKENNKWIKKEYNNASRYADRSRTQNGNTTMISYSLICRVLKCTDFVANTGDYVIKGKIKEKEITSNNILQLVDKYRPNAFKIALYRDNTNNPLPHYRLEGV